MGFFSTKKKHIVDTTVVRVVDDDMLPATLKTAVIRALFKPQDISPTIQDTLLFGSFRNFERAYRFARDGHYVYGLPDDRVMTSSDGLTQAEYAIEADLGHGVTLDYLYFRPINNIHAGRQWATENWGHNHETNELETLSAFFGRTFYLDKLVAVHATAPGLEPDLTSIGNWGTSTQSGATLERPFDISAPLQSLVIQEEIRVGADEEESVEIHYIGTNAEGGTIRGFETVSLASYDPDEEYYQARYHYPSGDGTAVGYWTYSPEEGRHPTLDAIFEDPDFVSGGSYFPFVVFRGEDHNRADEDDFGTPTYDSTVKYMKILKMDFQELADTIHENPDINHIDQAVMMMGVPITSTNVTEIMYLHDYFKALRARLPSHSTALPSLSTINGMTIPPEQDSYAINISDADFKITLSLDGIGYRLRAGNLEEKATNTVQDMAADGTLYFPGGIPAGISTRKVRVLSRQIRPGVIEELRIINPRSRYSVYKKKGVNADLNDERLLVPLDYTITQSFPSLRKEELYYRSLHFVFNSHVVEKTKWYERDEFKIVMIVVSIVITVVTWGADGGSTLWAALAAGGATAAAAIISILIELVIQFAISQIITFVASKLAELIGVEWVMVLAAIAMVYSTAKGFTSTTEVVKNATAQNMLKAANGLISGAQVELQNQFAEHMQDVAEFDLLVETRMTELDEAKKLLDPGIGIDPYTFIGLKPLVVLGESPDSYYQRLAHTGNPGNISLDLIENYAAISLKLPTLADTMGAAYAVNT